MHNRPLRGSFFRTSSIRCLGVGLAVLGLLAIPGPATAAVFQLPDASGWAVWEAEAAQRLGAWDVTAPGAGSERYLQPAGTDDGWALVFPFESNEPTNLRVRPVWWRTGEQKTARRFPHPLARQPGPEALDHVGTKVFCTVPAAGRVVVVDGPTEKVAGVVEVGGYLTDLVADPGAGRIFVADALGDRVVTVDPATCRVLSTWSVPSAPWSLALKDGTLYVACRDSQRIVAMNSATGEVTHEVELPASPISLELVGDQPAQLVVRFQQLAYDVFTVESLEPDEEQFPGAESTGKPGPGCGGPGCDCTWVESAGPHQIAVVSGEGRKVFDVGAVTRRPTEESSAGDLSQDPGPWAPVLLKVGEPAVPLCFFTSPSQGLVGVLNMASGLVENPIAVGGYLTDLVVDQSTQRLYVVDAAGQRAVVVDAVARKVEREIRIPGQPWAAAFVKEAAWQRPTDWQPIRGEGPIIPPRTVPELIRG